MTAGQMTRAAQAGAAITMIALIAVLASRRLPADHSRDGVRRCEVPPDAARPLDLSRAGDRDHLRIDAAAAEATAIAFADSSAARRQGDIAYSNARDDCMTMLFDRTAQTHAIDASVVREYAGHRDIVFDAALMVAFGIAYVLIVSQVIGIVVRRFAADSRSALLVALVLTSAMAVIVTLAAGDVLSIAAEILRIGNGHLSYRTQRLPWRQDRQAIVAVAVVVFSLIAALENRRRAID